MPPRSRYGQPGVLHGSYSYVMQDDDGQTCDVHRISAGLDYPGVGPEHSYWKDTGRVTYTSCRDDEALAAFDALARTEGILPALESSHAVAEAMELRPRQAERRCDRRLPLRPRRQGRRRNRPAQAARIIVRSSSLALSQLDRLLDVRNRPTFHEPPPRRAARR